MFPHPQAPAQAFEERLGQYADVRLARQVRSRHAANPTMTKVIRTRVAAGLVRLAPIIAGE